MGQEGSALVYGRCTSNRARRLFQVQRNHSTLLQEDSNDCRLAPWSPLQSAIHQLLQGWCDFIIWPRPCCRGFSLPGECWAGRDLKQDSQVAQELHLAWAGARVHMWPCDDCALHHLLHTRPSQEDSSAEYVSFLEIAQQDYPMLIDND